MKDSILIFGAGINQLTLINSANNLDICTIVLDPNPDAPGKSICDFFYCVEGNDYKSTKDIAIKHRVKGIVTSQMENPLRLMAKLAQELDFIFHKPKVIERSLNKWLMKQSFIVNSVPCAHGIILSDTFQLRSNPYYKYPLILKPIDSTSSKGVYKIDQLEDIKKYLSITRSFAKSCEVILEEYLDGPEFSIEAITYKGETTIVQFTEKFISSYPRTVEMGHLQPAALTEEQVSTVREVVIKAISALGIDNSASHTEIILTIEGPKIIEIGPRLGGDFISSYLTRASSGVNMDKAAIQVAMGFKPDIEQNQKLYAYIKYFELPPGKIVTKIDNYENLLDDPNMVFANIAVTPGSMIPEITESAKRPGFVIVKGDSRSEVLEMGNIFSNRLIKHIRLGQ